MREKISTLALLEEFHDKEKEGAPMSFLQPFNPTKTPPNNEHNKSELDDCENEYVHMTLPNGEGCALSACGLVTASRTMKSRG